MLLLVPVRRRATGGPGADALIRATQGLAAEITEQVPGTSWEIVAVPWSEDGPIPDDVAFAYGAEDVVDLEGRRSDVERTAAASLASRRQALTDKLYPSYSAVELGVAQRADGAVILLTGLSGSGKSTIARALVARLGQEGRNSTLLDGDEVRHHLSRGLGFDRRSRELNVERIGYVASLIAKHGGVAVAAPIAPFASGRAAVRSLAETYGRFLLVHVSTPLDVCEQRDRKGLYARARSGEIPDFTGISSPYETPDDADVAVDSTDRSIDETVDLIIKALSMPASLEPSARRSGAHVGKGGSLEADER
ncbi:adenylyl-sulfate kinase [Cellulomonas sp. PhB143]|nr:adenylyl-sulfate kinase [Cellulomonas sp. PhB143]